MIRFENVRFSYGEGLFEMRDLNVEIKRGEFVGVIGHSGAGKTTFAKLAVGLLKPRSGRVLVDGKDTRTTPVSELARKVGYVYQNPDLMIFSPTILDEVGFALRNMGYPESKVKDMVLRALESVDLSKPLDASPHMLSFGEKHRLAIASVLVTEPDVLILDEPTTGLDYARCLQLFRVLEKLYKGGKTVVVITHDLDLLGMFSTRVLVFEKGRLIRDGATEEVLLDTEFLEEKGFIPTQLQRLSKMLGLKAYSPSKIAEYIIELRKKKGI
ncbi:energy-coupling factor ABC transporter ATP-binding protein [Thermofilum pendens]|uniref:ABC transporter related n=1 Tax=Thermofilum pendens (strain DSM 2475 / Hrk 5) TaxID=368408 RepID=A1RW35_THEPD|nr:ABC transporter ATP-binding protein [Thermofilum pendens]ABL77415.1 ABC transporter related [Thermofilum pendens Hrk 5]